MKGTSENYVFFTLRISSKLVHMGFFSILSNTYGEQYR